ncbi:hypothetical protein ANTPLA_LOCUS6245 [Anthophora plagiata]
MLYTLEITVCYKASKNLPTKPKAEGFTVIFIKLLGTTTYVSSPMHGLYKMPELAILICLVVAKNLIDAVHECTFSNEL